jgi:hypothetical protein
MAAQKDPCCCDMKVLRGELHRRAKRSATAARWGALAANAGNWRTCRRLP